MASDTAGPKRLDLKSVIALGLTGGAIILEPISGVTSFIARCAALGAFLAADRQLRAATDRLASIEDRVTALEELGLDRVVLSGTALRLFALCLDRESTQLFSSVDADEALAVLRITPQEYKEAAEDLRDYGLVTIDPNMNSSTGIARTRLVPSAAIAAAPSLFSDADVTAEIDALLHQLRRITPEVYRLPVPEILLATRIPLPRLELLLRGMQELGFITGQGPGGLAYGSFLTVELTSSGRRLLRKDTGAA